MFYFPKDFDRSDIVDGEVVKDDYMDSVNLEIQVYDTIVYSKYYNFKWN